MRYFKWIIPMLLLTGCLGNASLSDLTTGAGAVAGAGISAAVGLPPVATIASTAVGAAAGSLAVAESESTADILEQLPEEERAAALRWQEVWQTIEGLGTTVIWAVLAFFLLPLIVGYFIPRRSELKMKRKLFDKPDIKMNDIE